MRAPWDLRPRLGPVGIAAGALVLGAAAAALGAGLAAVSSDFGDKAPLVLLGLVLLPLWALATALDPRWGVVAVFLTFPFGSIVVSFGVLGLQAVEVAVLGITAIVALSRLGTGRSALPWPPQMWWVLALLAWTLVALPSAIDQDLALKQIANLVGGALFALVVVAACREMRDVKIILGALVAIAGAIAAGAIVQGADFQVTFGGARVAGRAVSSFDHSNQLGSLCAMASLVLIGLIAGARTARARIAGAVLMLVLIGGQVLTLSRGAWIGTVVGTIFLTIVLPHARRALVTLAIPLAIVAVLMFAVAPDSTQVQVIGERFESLTVRSPYDDRPAIWTEAVREIVADPLTGQGPGGFPIASTRSSSEASTVFAYHAHDILLTWAAESGIPAALLIVGFAFSLIIAASKAKRRGTSRSAASDRAVMSGMAAALVALAAQGIVDYTLRNAVIFFAVWAIVGCLLAAIQIEPEPEPDEDQEDRWWAQGAEPAAGTRSEVGA